MGLFRQLLQAIFGVDRGAAPANDGSATETVIMVDPDLSGSLVDDCSYRGSGVYYLYFDGESTPAYIGKSENVRHRLRWHRYHLQQGDYPENPPVERVRWQVLRFDTEPEAWRFEQQEIRRLKPRLNGKGMSGRAIRARRARRAA